MKVMLVFPEMSLKAPEQPLGILYLAACLRDAGHEVRVVDMTPMNIDIQGLIKQLLEFKPEILGVSCMITTSRNACEIAKAVKKSCPEIITVVGGPNATVWPEHFVTSGNFDYAFVGEGELYFTLFCNQLADHRPEAFNTPGLVYIKNGQVHYNPRAPRVDELDGLPFPARDLVNMHDYQHSPHYFLSLGMIGANFNVITSRGCPFRCNFCDHSLYGYALKERSISKVLDEIEHVWDTYRVPNMEIDDDTFTLNLERVREFCLGLRSRGLDHLKWSARCRVSGITQEILQLMAEMGCVHVSFGVESINERVLKRINKNITRKQVDNATHWAKQSGMHVVANFIIGNLGDDRESIENSVNYALENNDIDIPSFTVITPLKNTEVYEVGYRNGWIRNTDWDFYNQKTVNMRNEALDFDDIEQIRNDIRERIHHKVRSVMGPMEKRWEECNALISKNECG